MGELYNSMQNLQYEERQSNSSSSKYEASDKTNNSNLEKSTQGKHKKGPILGKTSVKPNQKLKKQKILNKKTIVYLLAYTKKKKQDPQYYVCQAEVLEAPSPYTNSPHKLKILAVGLSKMHSGGTEEDGKTLLNKIVHFFNNRFKLLLFWYSYYLFPKSMKYD